MGTERFERMGWKNKAFDILNASILVLLMLTMFVPFINVVSLAFSSGMASMQPDIILFPKDFSIEGFTTVWQSLDLWRPFMNSVIVSVVGTFLHVFLSSMAGYVLIQPQMPGKKLMISFILLTMMIPQDAIMIPLYLVNKDLHLLNTLSSLILSGMVSGFSILLMRNYFLSVPYSMSEAAQIDGAGSFHIFAMYLGMAKTGLSTIALFEFVSRWNMITAPVLFINDNTKITLQVALKSMITDASATSSNFLVTTNVRMAGILITMIPLLVLYPFVQRYFMKGIMLGANKE